MEDDKVSGASGKIRTPDPQIRRLMQCHESKGFSLQTGCEKSLASQPLTIPLQTEDCRDGPPPEKLNPGALAGATGADSKADSFKNEEYCLRLERARILCLAIADCDPRDACQIMAAALDDLSAGMPGAPLFSYMDQAAWWSDLASEPELKAYLLACWTRLSPRVQDDFLRFIERRAAA